MTSLRDLNTLKTTHGLSLSWQESFKDSKWNVMLSVSSPDGKKITESNATESTKNQAKQACAFNVIAQLYAIFSARDIAYVRGGELKVGNKYPNRENRYLEFKGAKRANHANWTVADMNNYSFGNVHVNIAAFVNTAVLEGEVPITPPMTIFGIHAKSGTMHGIKLEVRDGDPKSTCDFFKNQQCEALRRKVSTQIADTNRGWKDRLLNSLFVDVYQLYEDDDDDVMDVSAIHVLLIVSLKIPKRVLWRPTELVNATTYDHKKGDRSKYYIRTAVSETVAMTAEQKLVVFGSA